MMNSPAADITPVTVSHSEVKKVYGILIDLYVYLKYILDFLFVSSFFQVYVKAGEILITLHLMDSTTVIKETVPMS